MKQRTREQVAMHVSLVTLIQNVALSVFKLAAGLLSHSGAMVSDAVHSASDVMTTFVVMAGVKLANKASDKEHPYGHERLECVAAILLSVLLGLTGLGIGWAGVEKIRAGGSALAAPGGLALVAAVVSIVVKEAMYCGIPAPPPGKRAPARLWPTRGTIVPTRFPPSAASLGYWAPA